MRPITPMSLVCSLLLSLPGLASDAVHCASIVDSTARLACYDGLHAPATPAPSDAPPPHATQRPAAPLTTADTPPAPSPRAAGDPDARFGAEALPAARNPDKADIPERIESRLIGAFEGWSKDSLFTLENGQVWRCMQCNEVYHRAESPAVTIRRSFTGVYWIKVEGLNQQAKVRRIK